MNDLPFGFLNACTFGFCEKRGFTKGQTWRWSLREMARTTGCNAVILPVCAWQEHTYSTQMDSQGPDVMDGEDVGKVCGLAREMGLRVILKAMVNCRDGYWRAYIRFFDSLVPTEPRWEDWVAAWEAHVCTVAHMARENGAEMLCVGCEMVGTDHREAEWRRLIAKVRGIYPGPITYNCDKYQEDRLSWWDAVDVMSSSGYYPLNEIDENLRRIQDAAEKAGKPFLFMECGCPSRLRSEHRPNDWRFGEGTDMKAQQTWYQAFTDALLRHPFVRGAGWWDWPATRLYPEPAGVDNNGYCVYGKPAAQTLRDFAKALESRQ